MYSHKWNTFGSSTRHAIRHTNDSKFKILLLTVKVYGTIPHHYGDHLEGPHLNGKVPTWVESAPGKRSRSSTKGNGSGVLGTRRMVRLTLSSLPPNSSPSVSSVREVSVSSFVLQSTSPCLLRDRSRLSPFYNSRSVFVRR